MKNLRLFLAGAGVFSALCGAEFAPGGVSFPMEKISAGRFGIKTSSSVNLLGDDLKAWRAGVWIFGPKANKDKTPQASKITNRSLLTIDGKQVLELNRPAELEKLMKDQTPEFTESFGRIVKLPDLAGGTYRMTFESRSQVIGKLRHMEIVLYNFHSDSDPRPGRGKATREYICSHINSTPNWGPYNFEFTVPPGTRDLELSIRGDGCGKLQVRSLRLEKLAASSAKVSVELSPMKLLDNSYALDNETLGTMGFRFKSNLLPGKLPWGNDYVFRVEFPVSVKILECNSLFGKILRQYPISVEGRKYTRYEIDCSSMVNIVRNAQGFNGWNVPALLLYGKDVPGKSYPCAYSIRQKEKNISDINYFTLKILPKPAKSAVPKQFLTGISSVSRDIEFPKNGEKMGAFLKDRGVNIAVGSWSRSFNDQLRKGGVSYITSECYAIANAFRIGTAPLNKRPADSVFMDKDGKPVIRYGSVSTCPYAVYSKGEYYQKHVVPLMKSIVGDKKVDGLQPNWEPWWWRSRGCFCSNCRSEFAKFTKMPLEKVKTLWPQQLLVGKPYYETAIKFRGWQHGKLIEALHELALANGAKMGFFPEVGTDQIMRTPGYDQAQGEFTPYAYVGKLKYLNVWGPYIWFLANQPYAYIKGAHLRFYTYSQRVFKDYSASFPDKSKRAKFMAMPHGSQYDMCALGQPEGMAMDQLSAFLTGYSSSVLYFFPRSYDHRYWNAFARANEDIARNEDMVLNGKVRKDFTVKAVTPYASPVESANGKFALLQVAGFEKDGKLLAAVGNFWEKADVVFTLQVPGLKANSSYTVAEAAFNRCFVAARGRSFTGAELARGIKLHAGALRWAFFSIEPGKKNSGEAVTAADMDKLVKVVTARTAKAAAEEAKRDKMLNAENDRGELKAMSSGALKCTVKNGTLVFVSGKNSAILDPKGMDVPSWRVNGQEQAERDFGLAAFWTPGPYGFQANSIYRITSQQSGAAGITVTGELTTTTRTYPLLPGLKIVKTVTFSSDLKKITLVTTLKNPTEVAMANVGFRWTFFPAAWNNRTPAAIKAGNFSFKRLHKQGLLKTNLDSSAETAIRKLFVVKNPTQNISGNVFSFTIPGKGTAQWTFGPAKLFGGVAVWDSADMIGATFEPCYRAFDIGPGESTALTAELSFR